MDATPVSPAWGEGAYSLQFNGIRFPRYEPTPLLRSLCFLFVACFAGRGDPIENCWLTSNALPFSRPAL